MSWRIVVAAMLAVPGIAEANHCTEVSPVVGYEQCRQFGWWAHAGMFSVEVGPVMMRFDPKAIDTQASGADPDGTATTYHVVGSATQPLTAVGGRIRMILNWGRHLHMGAETDITTLLEGPRLAVANISERGISMSMTQGGGEVMTGKLVIGEHASVGRLTFGGEAATGLRIANYSTTGLPPDAAPPAQAWLVLEAHARTEVWLSPQITLGGEAGLDVLQPTNVTVALMIGLHAMPFDLAR
jgi:hypothetical protein